MTLWHCGCEREIIGRFCHERKTWWHEWDCVIFPMFPMLNVMVLAHITGFPLMAKPVYYYFQAWALGPLTWDISKCFQTSGKLYLPPSLLSKGLSDSDVEGLLHTSLKLLWFHCQDLDQNNWRFDQSTSVQERDTDHNKSTQEEGPTSLRMTPHGVMALPCRRPRKKVPHCHPIHMSEGSRNNSE